MDGLSHAWINVEWSNVQIQIEGITKALSASQDLAEEGRQLLREESRKYQTATTKEERRCAVPLIKAFQKQVDESTARAKTAESTLIDFCARLTNVPDPLPILLQASAWRADAEKCARACEESNALRQQMQQLHAEFADLKNQDVTIRQLREKMKQLEVEYSAQLDHYADSKENELRDEFELKQRLMMAELDGANNEKITFRTKATELELKLLDIQAELDSARSESEGKAEQMRLYANDLQDASRRIMILEADVARLNKDLATSSQGDLQSTSVLEDRLKEKERQIALTMEENHRINELASQAALDADSHAKQLKNERDRHAKLLAEMKEKLDEKHDYDAIKKELRLLREIEFGESSESSTYFADPTNTPERLLREKNTHNKRLQNENATLRFQLEKNQETLSSCENELLQLREDYSSQRALILRLENDVAQSAGSTTEKLDKYSTNAVLEQMTEGENPTTNNNLSTILAAQRDRLRLRVQTLEEELMTEKTRQAVVVVEVGKLREDNVKLYEKLKFLQGYGRKTEGTVTVESGDDYSSAYEARLDPFRNFKRKEATRTYEKLQLHDRVSLGISKAVTKSATARMMFFVYLLCLHLLIFTVLYRYAYSESDSQQRCLQDFKNHMQQHHSH